jgi:chemotaxis protein MotB
MPDRPSPRADSGVPVGKQRRFPWRLWLYAIVITGAAGAAGYFGWQYRSDAKSATSKAAACSDDLAKVTTRAAASAKQAAECKTALDTATTAKTTLDKQLADLSKNLNASKEELDQLQAQKAESDKRLAAIADIQRQFAKMIDTGQLRVTARHGQLVLSLPAEVLFPSGSAELSKTGEYAVVEVAAVLKKFPGRRYMIVGHTDNQDLAKAKGAGGPACPFKDNLELSTARALTVARVMITAKMDPQALIAAGAGENDPVASNATAEGRQKNRRIEIVLLPAINELPPLPTSLEDKDDSKAPPDGTPAGGEHKG